MAGEPDRRRRSRRPAARPDGRLHQRLRRGLERRPEVMAQAAAATPLRLDGGRAGLRAHGGRQDLREERRQGARRHHAHADAGRLLLGDRLQRLRQVYAAQDHGGADPAHDRPGGPGRHAGRRAAPGHRHDVPAGDALPVADHAAERRAADRDPRRPLGRPRRPRPGAGAARPRRAQGLRGHLSRRALRRHGAARGDLPDAGHRAGGAAPRRAVQRAGRAQPRLHEHGAAAHLHATATRPPSSSPTRSRRR